MNNDQKYAVVIDHKQQRIELYKSGEAVFSLNDTLLVDSFVHTKDNRVVVEGNIKKYKILIDAVYTDKELEDSGLDPSKFEKVEMVTYRSKWKFQKKFPYLARQKELVNYFEGGRIAYLKTKPVSIQMSLEKYDLVDFSKINS